MQNMYDRLILKGSNIQHKEQVFMKISFSKSYKNVLKIVDKKVTLLLRKLYIRTFDEVRFLMTNYWSHL